MRKNSIFHRMAIIGTGAVRHIRSVLSFLVIAVLLLACGAFIASQAHIKKAEPFTERIPSPGIAMPDSGTGKGILLSSDVASLAGTQNITNASPQEKAKSQTAKSQIAESKESSASSSADKSPTKTDNQTKNNTNSASGSPNTSNGSGLLDVNLPGDLASASDTPAELEYFTTSIRDGETVTKSEYNYTVKHLVSTLSVRSVQASVNSLQQNPQRQGKLLLDNGANKVRIAVTYAKSDGKQISAYRDYTIYLVLPDSPEQKAEPLVIRTTLTNKTQADPFVSSNANFAFEASVTGGSKDASLTVVFDGVTLKKDGNTYRAHISKLNRTLTVRLRATDPADGSDITEYYYVKHVPVSDEATAPRLRHINVTEGMTVTGTDYTLDIGAEDYDGRAIGYQGLNVRLNGRTMQMQWTSEYVSYALVLKGGMNSLDIRVTDSAGRYADYSYTINCNEVGDGDVLGTIKISVDATVLGLGWLVPPTDMEVHQGETGANIVDRLLSENGFAYTHDGSFTSGFYLKKISRAGLASAVNIPADLAEALANDGYVPNDRGGAGSLGEGDYYKDSGWMYSKNGSFPGYGFTDTKLQDGDTVKIRFTLAAGKDIGGGSENYGKVW